MEETDDDFGDLYADVEVQACSAINAAVQAFPVLSFRKGAVAEGNSVGDDDESNGSVEEDEMEKEKEVAEAGVVSDDDDDDDDDDNGSDSEDDLKIVLNSDGDGDGGGTEPSFPVPRSLNLGGMVVGEEDEERENGGRIGVTGLVVNGLNDKFENVPGGAGGGCGGERGNGRGKGGYHTQYKYIRSQSAAFGNKAKENGCAAISPYSYLSARADREDNGCGQRVGSGPLVAQSGHNFSLPRSRTILDVNIDIFERKPWRHPGSDITDFFNFDFDEESWKRYCNQLDKYRHRAAIPTRVLPFDSFKSTKAYEVEHETIAHEVVGEKTRSQQSEMQKGRAIQVEDSITERQPSMDLRRPLDRDSDVIQITVQDSRENSSGTMKEDSRHEDRSLHEVSENEDNGVDESGEFLCFSSASEDELYSESPDGHHEGMDMPVSKRSSKQTTGCPGPMDSDNHGSLQISDVDRHHNRMAAVHGSEGTHEGIETSNNTKERVGGDTCTADPSLVEAESSQREKSQYSLRSSCSVSHSEAIEDSSYIDTRKSYSRINRPSTNSISKSYQLKSIRSERSDVKTKPAESRYYERHRSTVHDNGRFHGMSKSKNPFDDKDTIPLFDAEELYDVHHSTVDHSRVRAKERLPAFDSYYDGNNLPYHKESELSFEVYNERFSDYVLRDDHTKDLHKKCYRGFGAETDRFMFRNSDEGGYFLKERLSMMDDEVMARDWYHYERRLAVEDVGPLNNQELEQLNLEYSSYLDDERGARWKRKGDALPFRRRWKNDEVFHVCKYSNDLRRGKYKRSFTYDDRVRDNLEHNHDRHIPYSRREVRNPGSHKRRFGSPSVGLDNYWSAGDGDGYLKGKDNPSFSSRSFKEPCSSSNRRCHDAMMPRSNACDRQGKHRRQWSERFRDGGSFGGDWNAFDTEEIISNIGDRIHLGRTHHSEAERLQWSEDDNISRHQGDKFDTQGAPFSFERTSRHKRFDAAHKSDHAEELIKDMHVEGGRYKQKREGNNRYQFDRTPNISQSHEQMFLSCKDSIDSDLVVVEGKSSRRYRDRHEKMDWNIDTKQKTRRDLDAFFSEKVVQIDNPEVETNPNDEKWLDKFPVTQHNEALDIEEGQIIAEENNEGALDNICASEAELPRSDAKEFRNQNGRNGQSVEGYDKPRILEVMAKMEKRRERFKEPISLRKDSDIDTVTSKTLIDSVDGTTATKLQRPARKRRWGGS